ncbi:winged helix-turn-helix domain-containing protein [Streptomyces scopuliridis]
MARQGTWRLLGRHGWSWQKPDHDQADITHSHSVATCP